MSPSEAATRPNAIVLGQSAQIVDLSLPLDEGLPCAWPGHTAFATRIDVDFGRGASYRTGSVVMDEHSGTHVDAPVHAIAGARTAASIPLGDLIGPAVVIDVQVGGTGAAAGRSSTIGADMLLDAERADGRLQPGDIVLLRTGWDDRYVPFPAGSAYVEAPLGGEDVGWPALDESFIELVVERGVRCVGTDAPSIAPIHDPGPVHVHALGSGLWPVEGLARLATLPRRGATFAFLPLFLSGSGAPGRAIGLIPARA